MIDPPAPALRRRSIELEAAAKREMSQDQDSAALLMFYAAECGLKHIYMNRHNLRSTSDARGRAQAAREFGHNLQAVILALGIPRSSLGPAPPCVVTRTGGTTPVRDLHQAWRYGEKVTDTPLLLAWLSNALAWVKKNR